MLKAKIVKDRLVVEIPITREPSPSKSGKTLVVASSRGIVSTDAVVNGANVMIGLNAFIPRNSGGSNA